MNKIKIVNRCLRELVPMSEAHKDAVWGYGGWWYESFCTTVSAVVSLKV